VSPVADTTGTDAQTVVARRHRLARRRLSARLAIETLYSLRVPSGAPADDCSRALKSQVRTIPYTPPPSRLLSRPPDSTIITACSHAAGHPPPTAIPEPGQGGSSRHGPESTSNEQRRRGMLGVCLVRGRSTFRGPVVERASRVKHATRPAEDLCLDHGQIVDSSCVA